jgi:hypothetical protein
MHLVLNPRLITSPELRVIEVSTILILRRVVPSRFRPQLMFEINDLKEMVNGRLVTRNKDASFTENVRLCAMELSGLEVVPSRFRPQFSDCSNFSDINVFARKWPSSTIACTVVGLGKSADLNVSLKDDSENMKEEKTQEYIIESLEHGPCSENYGLLVLQHHFQNFSKHHHATHLIKY